MSTPDEPTSLLVRATCRLRAACFVRQLERHHVGCTDSTKDVQFEEQIRPFFAEYCQECHGEQKPKADLRLDQLAPNFTSRAIPKPGRRSSSKFRTARCRPSRNRVRPKRRSGDDGLDHHTIESKRRQGAWPTGGVVMRRLNRNEYENTVHDLLGIDVDLKQATAADGMADGFDNVGSALHVSSFLMEKYLEAADKALNLAIVNRPKPPAVKKRYLLKDQHYVKNASERVYRQIDDDTTVCFSSSALECRSEFQSSFIHSFDFQRGHYRFRISASAFQSGGKPVTFRVESTIAGPRIGRQERHGRLL